MRRSQSFSSRVKFLTAQGTFAGVEFADHDNTPPVFVFDCPNDTDAFQKGVRKGDVVVSIDSEDVRDKNWDQLKAILGATAPGTGTGSSTSTAPPEHVVGLERQEIQSIAQDDAETEASKYQATLRDAVQPLHVYFPSSETIGITFQGGDTFDEANNQFTAVRIGDFEPDSQAPAKNLRAGDILIAVNEVSVEGSSLHETLSRIYACRAQQETLHLTFDQVELVVDDTTPARVHNNSSSPVARERFQARRSAAFAIKIVEDDNLDDLILVGGKEVYPNAVQYSPIRVASIAFGSSLRARGFVEGDVIVSIDGVSVQNRSMAYALRRLRLLWSSSDRNAHMPAKTILVDRQEVATQTASATSSPQTRTQVHYVADWLFIGSLVHLLNLQLSLF